MLHTLPSLGIIVDGTIATIKSGTASSTSPDLTSNPLANLIIGVLIGAIPTLISLIVNVGQQSKRDKEAAKLQDKRDGKIYAQQKEREQIAFEQQLKREQLAYERTVKDAKRDRLRSAYKVILNGAEAYLFVIQRISPIPGHNEFQEHLEDKLRGIEEALVEITLEDLSSDVRSIFFEVRGIYYGYVAKLRSDGSAGTFDPGEDWKALENKVEELKAAMNRSLNDI